MTYVETRMGQHGICHVVLQDPTTKNALTSGMRMELQDHLRQIARLDEVRVVVIRGAEGTFCSGGELGSIPSSSSSIDIRRHFEEGVQALVREMLAYPKVTLAAIEGAAVGAGLDLALACDFRCASTSAVLHTGFSRLNLPPVDGGSALLRAILPRDRALLAYCSRDFISAETGLAWGLLTEVHADSGYEGALDQFCLEIARCDPLALSATKALLARKDIEEFDDCRELATWWGAACASGEAYEQALSALIARR